MLATMTVFCKWKEVNALKNDFMISISQEINARHLKQLFYLYSDIAKSLNKLLVFYLSTSFLSQ